MSTVSSRVAKSVPPPVPWNANTMPAGCAGTYEMTGNPSNVLFAAVYVGATAQPAATSAAIAMTPAMRKGFIEIPPQSSRGGRQVDRPDGGVLALRGDRRAVHRVAGSAQRDIEVHALPGARELAGPRVGRTGNRRREADRSVRPVVREPRGAAVRVVYRHRRTIGLAEHGAGQRRSAENDAAVGRAPDLRTPERLRRGHRGCPHARPVRREPHHRERGVRTRVQAGAVDVDGAGEIADGEHR